MTENTARSEETGHPLSGKAWQAEALARHPGLAGAEALIASRLIRLHAINPKLPRLKSTHRKWLLTHSLFALTSARDPMDPLSGLTASRLIDTVIEIGAASRNTATAFLQEMLTYKFLQEVPDVPDRRVRVLDVTDVSVAGMRVWFDAHMEALDLLDGGARLATAEAHPQIFRLAQAAATRALVDNPDWREPRDSIAGFAWSDAGGMILHDLITRLPGVVPENGRYVIGPLAVSALADRYLISVSNAKRMFMKAERDGLAGWTEPRRRGAFWMSEALIADYFHWEATKLAALDRAYRDVVTALGLGG